MDKSSVAVVLQLFMFEQNQKGSRTQTALLKPLRGSNEASFITV